MSLAFSFIPSATWLRTLSWSVALSGLLTPVALSQVPAWEADPFTAQPGDLLRAAQAMPAPSEAHAVVLLGEERYFFDERGAVRLVVRQIYHVLTQQGADAWNSINSVWQPWRQDRPALRARVIGADESVHELDPATITEVPAETGAPTVFTDRRVLRGPLPAVSPGSVVVMETTTQDQHPAFDAGVVHRFYFASFVPVRKARLLIEAPRSLPIRYVARNGVVEPERTETGNRLTLKFEAGPFVDPRFPEPDVPQDGLTWPHVTFGTGKSWNAVARRYRKILDQQIAGHSLEAILSGISTEGSRRSVIQRLTKALHERIRYAAVLLGEASYIPRTPSETLQRRFGDCKDKAALLIAMLRAVGIDATIALLRTGSGSDPDDDVPGLGLFDHTVVFVPDTSDPMWIDATDPYSAPGELPLADQGRLALIADEHTASLVRTPSSSSQDNRAIETRDVFLASYGAARIVESTQAWGFVGRDYRENFDGLTGDEIRNAFLDYAAQVYLSDNVAEATTGDTFDFSTPYEIRIEVKEAFRGITDVMEAVVAIPLAGLLQGLPPSLLTDPAVDPERKSEFEWSRPHSVEWRYRIVPPIGFIVRELPADRDERLGSARFSAQYSRREDQSVLAALIFDSGKRRLMSEEFRETRKRIHEFAQTEVQMIAFDQVGETHLAAGKIREAIEEFRELSRAEPDAAIHLTRIARAMLEAGLGEPARQAAERAVELGPESAMTHRTQGSILEYDLIGRRFQSGSDYAGAEAAYRKAIELDPEDVEARAALAILLEHDSQGERYGKKARLAEAVEQYRSALATEASSGVPVDPALGQSLVAVLAHAGRFGELKDYLDQNERPDLEAYRIAALTVLDGIDQAAVYASRTVAEPSQYLAAAGVILLVTRQYQSASDLYSAAARGALNAGQLMGQARVFKGVQPFESLDLDSDRPRSAADRMTLHLFGARPGKDIFQSLTRHAERYRHDQEKIVEIEKAIRQARTNLRQMGLPVAVVLDIALSGQRAAIEGDDTIGYRITTQVGSQNSRVIVIREGGEYRVLSMDVSKSASDLAREVLARADAGELKSAAKLLDWVWEPRAGMRTDDSLAAPPFVRFWTLGTAPTVESLRYAAASVLAEDKTAAEDAAEILLEGREKAESDEDRLRFDLALTVAFSRSKSYEQLSRAAHRVFETHPESDHVFSILTASLQKQGLWTEFDELVNQRLKERPGSAVALRSKIEGAMVRKDMDTVIALTEQLERQGQVVANDLNNRVWAAITADRIDEEAVQTIERGIVLAQANLSPAYLHTQAALYAETDRPAEARQVLLQYLARNGLDDPDSATWYVLGRIAEAYDEPEAARSYYKRTQPPENPNEVADSSYAVAQRRLSGLASASR